MAGVAGLATAQFGSVSNFTGWTFTTTPGAAGWVIVDQDGTLNNASGAAGATRPLLASEYSTTISNGHQLQLIAMNLGASYTLANNVSLAEISNPSGVCITWFSPLGNSATPFMGSLNGLGYAIDGLTINSGDNAGLFLQTGVTSTISNLGLTNVSVSGGGFGAVGAVAGVNDGVIFNVYATGNVSTFWQVGGLVGVNAAGATITSSFAAESVSGSLAGGLTSENFATISESYFSGSVYGGDTGGLAAQNNGRLVNSFYDVDTVAINGSHFLTVGRIYDAQYQDWFSHGLSLNISI